LLIPLPIDSHLDEIVAHVRRSRAAVVTAAPGAGKTTRVPPALLADGRVILLQPRRVAARAMATRIAAERGWTIGREVGWQIRFERRFSADTQLLVVTEGVLTARLQADPLLSDFTTIILDEFHERSIHADLALALARQAWRARAPSTRSGSSPASSRDNPSMRSGSSRAASRDDLRIVVMSATLESGAVSAFLDGCPVVDVPGRTYPLEIGYAAGQPVASAAVELLGVTSGNLLCFLPGAGEIRRAMNDLQTQVHGDVDVVPLHGSLDGDAQDLALRPSTRRRIIVATNIAETSLTVPGVTAVIDAGLHKVARYDADRGIDSLETERITADAADQRAGRAGREAPGVVRRLWDARDRLRPHREPEIHRIDLAGTALDVIAWGGDPRTLEWFDRPGDDALDAALTLLARLGLIDGIRLTPIGEQVRRLPLHPRLGRMLVAAGGARPIAQACALLSERHLLPPRTASTSSDLLSAVDDWRSVPFHVQQIASRISEMSDFRLQISDWSETAFLRAVLAGYPDRVAQRRAAGSASVKLASGAGAIVAAESGVRDGEFLVALDVRDEAARGFQPGGAARPGQIRGPQRAALRESAAQDARIRMASRVEREWLQPTVSEVVHRFDKDTGKVRAVAVDRYDALILAERHVAVDPEVAAQLVAAAWLARGPGEDDVRLLRRLRFAQQDVDLESLVRTAAYGARALDDVRIARALAADAIRDLDREAPETLAVPSGRHTRLDYNEDGTVSASVKLQELFGLAETPRIGRRKEPVVLSLLAPNGRPVQVTRDLRSFWDRTYPEVRKELRGRYPRHPWPEDPWTAPPTARTTKRR
jgi:ATP-dependent helicase HrpB